MAAAARVEHGGEHLLIGPRLPTVTAYALPTLPTK
jgi:hypothetical protein